MDIQRDETFAPSLCPEEEQSQAAPEVFKNEDSFGCWHWLVYLSSIGGYFYDIATDIMLVTQYEQRARTGVDAHYWYFGLTVFLITVPAYLVAIMSSFKPGDDEPKKLSNTDTQYSEINPLWLKRLKQFFVVLLLSPVGRRIFILYHGYKENYQFVEEEKKRIAFFGLFETFLEEVPQILLQSYVFLMRPITMDDWSDLSLLETWQIAKLIGSFWSIARALNNFNNTYFKTLQIPNNPNKVGGKESRADSSICSQLTSMFTKMYQSFEEFFRNPTSTMKNSTFVREFKIDETIFFVAHFLGIASRVIAVSAFCSFYFKLCLFQIKKGSQTEMDDKCSNQLSEIFFDAINGAYFVVILLAHYVITIKMIHSINTVNNGIKREFWRKRLRLFLIMGWINLFTFYPPSESFLNRNQALVGDQRSRRNNSPKRDYCGTRFYLFFFVYYVVILVENGIFLGFWWMNLGHLLPYAPNNLLKASIILCLQICFSLFSPFLLMIYYSIHRRTPPDSNDTPAINKNNSNTQQQQEAQVELPTETGEIHQDFRTPVALVYGFIGISHEDPDASSIPKFGPLNASFISFGCVSLIVASASDIRSAFTYYFSMSNIHFTFYGAWTTNFAIVLPIFYTLSEILLFRRERKRSNRGDSIEPAENSRDLSMIYKAHFFGRLGRTFIQWYYGVKSRRLLMSNDHRKAKEFYDKFKEECRNNVLTNLFETFLRFAPYAILPFYLLIKQIEEMDHLNAFMGIIMITIFRHVNEITLYYIKLLKRIFLNREGE